MKKIIGIILSLLLIIPTVSAYAAQNLYYDFENDSLNIVNNTLGSGSAAKYAEGFSGSKGLLLDETYGVSLGAIGNVYSVAAMVRITSTGGTDTLFFKNMGTASSQKWTGVQANASRLAFWTHGDGYSWKTVAENASASLSDWSYVVYTENSGIGSLYLNGTLIGSGSVAKGNGELFLGATYWSGDAIGGMVDELKIFDNVLTQNEILQMYDEYAKESLSLPSETIGNINLPTSLGTATLTWESSDESVISSTGVITRADEDKTVSLTAYMDGEFFQNYTITVLKKPLIVNNKTLLEYDFTEADNDIIHDVSGNGNHGQAYGNVEITENGAYLDGAGAYISMPENVLNSQDNLTIVLTAKPESAQQNIFAYGFGNSQSSGYMFLNTSRPTTNTIRFAITKTSFSAEKDIASVPGIRANSWGTAVVTTNGSFASLYLDGELVMNGDLGIKPSDLGSTTLNYIGKSLYDGDPYFKGYISEFKILGYAMDKDEIKSLYAQKPEYASEEKIEYLTSVTFSDSSAQVTIDKHGRDDVLAAAVVLDENANVISFDISDDETLDFPKGANVSVFAFDTENNSIGAIYSKGENESITYESTPDGLTIAAKLDSYSGGNAIIAGYDITGTLTAVTVVKKDIVAGETIEIDNTFADAVSFKLMYWDSIVSMLPIE